MSFFPLSILHIVWDAQSVYFYVQDNEGVIVPDDSEKLNPRPHTLYKRDKKVLYKGFGFIPFFRLDNNKKKSLVWYKKS